jgi:transcriptional regulator with XRE-family HTH domain
MKTQSQIYRKQLGKNIRTLRAMHGYTQKELASYLNMCIANISNIENGYTNIDTYNLKKLTSLFGLNESDIINFHLHPFFQLLNERKV